MTDVIGPMTPFQAVILGLVQGLTEFLPISSTAHLRIVPWLFGWEDPGAAFSAAIQLGTLVAVFVFFARDIQRLTVAALQGIAQRNLRHSPDSLMAWAIVPATIPIVVFGLGFKDYIENKLRHLEIISWALIVLALLLLLAERIGKRDRKLERLTFWRIQLIGWCQALALIPGCSRSGSTIMGGLFVGLSRPEAARFSFLLGLPAIAGSGLFELMELMAADPGMTGLLNLAIGIAVAAVSGYVSIGFLLRFLERFGTHAFAIYRIVLGAVILISLRTG
ncbi:MAG: undecaprenyl-diphosphatase UppP [Candidatus Latescibacterota bacterium]|nr:undecaprenyl-diphosphatase UppP [Candidatus Latescibacterota bacterium]MEE3261426.1 undecaprenyl-diphosphatase UppP [Candidatus Latescibacterota bacterium]